MSIRSENPVIVPLKQRRKVKPTYKKPKLDVKRFKKETGQHFYVVKGLSISTNRYKWFDDEQKAQRIAQVIARRHSSARVRKQESRQQLLRRAKQLDLTKMCTMCKETKLYPEFDRRWDKKVSRLTLRSYCKGCRSEMNRQHYLKRTKDDT